MKHHLKCETLVFCCWLLDTCKTCVEGIKDRGTAFDAKESFARSFSSVSHTQRISWSCVQTPDISLFTKNKHRFTRLQATPTFHLGFTQDASCVPSLHNSKGVAWRLATRRQLTSRWTQRNAWCVQREPGLHAIHYLTFLTASAAGVALYATTIHSHANTGARNTMGSADRT